MGVYRDRQRNRLVRSLLPVDKGSYAIGCTPTWEAETVPTQNEFEGVGKKEKRRINQVGPKLAQILKKERGREKSFLPWREALWREVSHEGIWAVRKG